MKSQIDEYLNKNSNDAGIAFHEEISTDENKDYRRGFRAGVFFAFLQLKSDIGCMEEIKSE